MSIHRIAVLSECIKQHIGEDNIWSENCALRQTNEYGCGVFAARDIEPNETLFRDIPLMLGPTGKSTDPIVCVLCYCKMKDKPEKYLCKNKCGLVVCESS